jgi:RNA-directed DNA polymerase
MEEACDRTNLRMAWRRVKANRGSPGVDGMTVAQLPGYLEEHWPVLRIQLLAGTYRPQPVKRVEIPKPGGGVRVLGIPTVIDRLIQQALLQVLQPRWDPTFSEHSYGFRPGRSAHQAVAAAQRHQSEGYRWVVDMDLEKFFDRVHHDRLMARVAERVSDRRMLRLIRAYLTAGVMEGGLVSPRDEGTPQGGPLSPLLSNLVLDELDRELARRGHRFVRYADDCNVYVRSLRSGMRVMESMSVFITRRLKLRVNVSKSAVDRPWRRKFLGFSFTHHKTPKRTIAPESVRRLKRRVRELTRRNRRVSVETEVRDLAAYLRGWLGYFGETETISLLPKLDRWVQRRLRSWLWKQWPGFGARLHALGRRGLPRRLAAPAAASSHGPWRMSRSIAMHSAYPHAYFRELGLPPLVPKGTLNQAEPPCTGPVRTVV